MKLQHYFRLITMSIFQSRVTSGATSPYGGRIDYDSIYFSCPRIICKDGFNVSLQINHGSYCATDKGYRKLGTEWKTLEFGFPTMNEPLMHEYSEMWDISEDDVAFDKRTFDVTKTVGSIPIEVMEEVCEKHGGIDWDETLSAEVAGKWLEIKE